METPTLDYLLGTYFHQDFHVEHGGVWQTIDAFLTDDPHLSPMLPAEIDARLACSTEEDLRQYSTETGCEYLPQEGEGGYRGWLMEIARRVRASNSQT